ALDHLSDHVVDQAVLIPDTLCLELSLILGVVQFLEDVLEAAIVLLENSVLSAHIEGKALVEGKLEASVSETSNALVRVVLGLSHAATVFVLEHFNLLRFAIGRGVNHA